jgi:hypothetical protein
MHISRAGPRRSLSQRLGIARRPSASDTGPKRGRGSCTGIAALRTSAQRQRGRAPPASRHREAGRHPGCPDPRAPRPGVALGRAVDARRILVRRRARGDRRGRPHRRPGHDNGADGGHRPLRQLTPMTPLLTPPFHGEMLLSLVAIGSSRSRKRAARLRRCTSEAPCTTFSQRTAGVRHRGRGAPWPSVHDLHRQLAGRRRPPSAERRGSAPDAKSRSPSGRARNRSRRTIEPSRHG